jgi:GT2 family glycosyltransferase
MNTSRSDTVTMPAVDIIVITFNGMRFLERCLKAVERTNYPSYRVILVDNGSEDGSGAFVAKRFPDCHVIRTGKNLGFAAGNNVALRLSLEGKAEFVVLLNDDAFICDPEWLSKAVSVATADPSIGMVGFEVVKNLGLDDPTAGCPPVGPLLPVRSVSRIDGCSLFIRSAVLRRIGLLDEIYFMYGEEDDLEMRALTAGYILVAVDSIVSHVGGATSSRYPIKIAYYQARNYLRFALKNLSPWRAIRRTITLLDILCNPFPLIYRDTDVAHVRMRRTGSLLMNCGIYCLAILWNLSHLPQTLKLRFLSGRY